MDDTVHFGIKQIFINDRYRIKRLFTVSFLFNLLERTNSLE